MGLKKGPKQQVFILFRQKKQCICEAWTGQELYALCGQLVKNLESLDWGSKIKK